eukprot:Hpha_TRINITY_DN12117_c0_g1::TRINITY_DN12117_c0_g1_i1::g.81974::m.81974
MADGDGAGTPREGDGEEGGASKACEEEESNKAMKPPTVEGESTGTPRDGEGLRTTEPREGDDTSKPGEGEGGGVEGTPLERGLSNTRPREEEGELGVTGPRGEEEELGVTGPRGEEGDGGEGHTRPRPVSVTTEDLRADEAPKTQEGYLEKYSVSASLVVLSNWKKRWMVSQPEQLQYFKARGDEQPQGVVPYNFETTLYTKVSPAIHAAAKEPDKYHYMAVQFKPRGQKVKMLLLRTPDPTVKEEWCAAFAAVMARGD